MDEQSFWMRNIDKISYVVAGVLAIGILAVPLAMTGKAVEDVQGLEEIHNELKKKIADPVLPSRAGGERLVQWLQERWAARPSAVNAPWSTERRPVLVNWTPQEEGRFARHYPGHVARLHHRREASPQPDQMSFIEVTGVMNTFDLNVVHRSVELLRKVWDPKTEAWGELSPVRGFRAQGDFTYRDYAIEPGKKYGYAFTTTAASKDPSQFELPPAQETQTSAECALEESIPYDFNFAISLIRTGPDGSPVVSAVVSYFDHDSGEVVELRRANYKEGERFGPGEKNDERYEVRRILETEQEVWIRDKVNPLARPVITRKLRYSVAPIPAVECPAPPPPGTAAPAAGEAAPT
ncbi:MAG: hypothetical protein JXA90_17030, partial [Planctomycetes bacterium]|nr:hypothetical protein [Planctomycetota bacterium]